VATSARCRDSCAHRPCGATLGQSFDLGHLELAREVLLEKRDVLEEKLFVKLLGAGRNGDPLAEISKILTGRAERYFAVHVIRSGLEGTSVHLALQRSPL
jgi:hypothetical protein